MKQGHLHSPPPPCHFDPFEGWSINKSALPCQYKICFVWLPSLSIIDHHTFHFLALVCLQAHDGFYISALLLHYTVNGEVFPGSSSVHGDSPASGSGGGMKTEVKLEKKEVKQEKTDYDSSATASADEGPSLTEVSGKGRRRSHYTSQLYLIN